MLKLLLLVLFVIGSTVLAQSPPLSAQDSKNVYPDLNTTNALGTWIYGFDECPNKWKRNIKEAYDDFKALSHTDGVFQNIDWNSAAALEYLGPAAFNKKQQKQIQAVFANAATVYPGSFFSPFKWYIRVRCDDPFKRCDRCNPPENPPPPKLRTKLTAYSRNKDPTDNRYPMINFCQAFFDDKRSLTNALAYGSGLTGPDQFDLGNYLNRAETMFHELLHLNNVADSFHGSPNPVVDDMTITYLIRDEDCRLLTFEERAYGPVHAKLLARFTPIRGDHPTGYYIQRNSENLSLYALAKYVQSKIGVYPHIPVIREYELEGTPWIKPNQYVFTNTTTVLMYDAPVQPVPRCNDRLEDDADVPHLTIGWVDGRPGIFGLEEG